MGWRDHLPVHPAADLFPLMSESELRELGENIKTHGLKSRLKLYKGKLLDGRNRLEAMELVGVAVDWRDDVAALGCPFDHLDERVDPYDYVIALNLHRRHLTSEQKRELIAKILKAKPETSNRKIAKQTKADHKTVAAVRRDLESIGEIPQLEKSTGSDGKQRKSRAKKALELARVPDHHATGSAEVSIEQRRAENARLDEDGGDIVERALSLVTAMTDQQRAQFFAKYTELIAVRAPARPSA
jgi:hypothetical protein